MISWEGEKNLMTIYQQLKEEGKIEGKAEGELIGLQKGKVEGKIEGKAEGELLGLQKGKVEGKLEAAQKMREKGFSINEIAEITSLSKDEINRYLL